MDLRFPEITPRFGDALKGGDPEWAPGYETSIREFCGNAREEAELDRKSCDELKAIGSYIDYVEGRQWKGQRPAYKSKPVNPKVGENFWEMVGLLTDIKPIMAVKSENPDKGYQEAALILNKGIRAWSYKTRYDQRLALNVAYGILTSSFCKWQFNPDLAHGAGDLEALPMGPNDLLLLKPQVEDPVQTSLCVIREQVVDMGWLKRKYPTRGHLVRPDAKYSSYSAQVEAPARVPSMLWDMMNDGMKRVIGGQPQVKSSAFPSVMQQEFWFRDYSTNTANVPVTMGKYFWKYVVNPGGMLYPRGRVVVRAGDITMDDQASPYFHGKYPFTMLRLNVVPWSIYGLSEVKNWISLQDILNQILAGIIDMIKRAVNPGFFAPRNAFTEQVWNTLDFSKPGERAAYSPVATHEPKFAPAPVLPGYVMQTYQMIERSLDQMSGKSAANQMMGKKQIPGADGIEAIQMMRTTPIRLKSKNIEGFMEDGGNMMVSNMIQFYNSKRRMSLWGRAGTTSADFDWDPGTMIPAGVKPEEFIRALNYHVKPGSLLQSEKRSKIQDAMNLRRGGDLDRRSLFRIIDEEGLDVEEVEGNLKREVEQKIAAMPQKGPKGKPK